MSAIGLKLLRTAAEMVGGDKTLASRLGIGEKVLTKYLAGNLQLPDLLLLRAVDIILADRQSRLAGSVENTAELPGGSGAGFRGPA